MRCRLPGPQLPGADRELAGDVRLAGRREGRDLLVAHMQPAEAALLAKAFGEAVKAVADDPVDPLHTGRGERFDHLVGNGGHGCLRT